MDDHIRPGRDSSRLFTAVMLLFFFSGLIGLLYEVVWFRRLHLVFGVSTFAIGAVVTAFMLGLAAGSRWAGTSCFLRNKPLETYVYLEAAIALYALAFPLLASGLEQGYVAIFRLVGGSFLTQSVVRFLLGFLLLLPPTFCMGATLPALAQAVGGQSKQVARNVGRLYMVNTLGGVIGTLVAGFYALEFLGIRNSLYLGLTGNVMVASAGFYLIRHPAYRTRPAVTTEPARPVSVRPARATHPLFVFAAVMVTVTGLVSMAAEIV
jgi:spermidine synthase